RQAPTAGAIVSPGMRGSCLHTERRQDCWPAPKIHATTGTRRWRATQPATHPAHSLPSPTHVSAGRQPRSRPLLQVACPNLATTAPSHLILTSSQNAFATPAGLAQLATFLSATQTRCYFSTTPAGARTLLTCSTPTKKTVCR